MKQDLCSKIKLSVNNIYRNLRVHETLSDCFRVNFESRFQISIQNSPENSPLMSHVLSPESSHLMSHVLSNFGKYYLPKALFLSTNLAS